MTSSETLWFEELAEACAQDGIYDCLFSGVPLKAERATGAPFNPQVLEASPEPEHWQASRRNGTVF